MADEKARTYLDVAQIYQPEGVRRNKKDGSLYSVGATG